MIFYRVVKHDFNNDSVYDSKDAIILYVSDLDGKNLIQITPDNERFVDYTKYSEHNLILIKTIIDSNNDSIFANTDETSFREMKLNNPAMGKEIFSVSLRDSLRSILKSGQTHLNFQ